MGYLIALFLTLPFMPVAWPLIILHFIFYGEVSADPGPAPDPECSGELSPGTVVSAREGLNIGDYVGHVFNGTVGIVTEVRGPGEYRVNPVKPGEYPRGVSRPSASPRFRPSDLDRECSGSANPIPPTKDVVAAYRANGYTVEKTDGTTKSGHVSRGVNRHRVLVPGRHGGPVVRVYDNLDIVEVLGAARIPERDMSRADAVAEVNAWDIHECSGDPGPAGPTRNSVHRDRSRRRIRRV